MIDTITQYLQKAKDFPQVPVGTSQTIAFWLTHGRAANSCRWLISSVLTSTRTGLE